MPVRGPNDTLMYRPSEAYEAVGRQLFQSEWELFFSSQRPLPHAPTLEQIQAREGKESPTVAAVGDPNDDQYRVRQRRARRSRKVFTELVHALHWAKTVAWQRTKTGEWSSVHYDQWEPGSGRVQDLEQELDEVITRNAPSSGQLLIEKDPLDTYLRGWVMPEIPGTLAPAVRREAKRPALDKQAMVDVLCRWEANGELPDITRGWRQRVCEMILAQNLNWYPTAKSRKRPPSTKTIKKCLKHEFDAIEERLTRK